MLCSQSGRSCQVHQLGPGGVSMPVDADLAVATLLAELEQLGIRGAKAEIAVVDGASDSYVVTIISEVFDGQTYLDRDMRVRSAVARTFSALKHQRASFIVDPQTPSERASVDAAEATELLLPEEGESPAERIGRIVWRSHREAIFRAL